MLTVVWYRDTAKARWSRDEVCVWKHFSVRPIPSSYMVRRRVAIVLLIDVRIDKRRIYNEVNPTSSLARKKKSTTKLCAAFVCTLGATHAAT